MRGRSTALFLIFHRCSNFLLLSNGFLVNDEASNCSIYKLITLLNISLIVKAFFEGSG